MAKLPPGPFGVKWCWVGEEEDVRGGVVGVICVGSPSGGWIGASKSVVTMAGTELVSAGGGMVVVVVVVVVAREAFTLPTATPYSLSVRCLKGRLHSQLLHRLLTRVDSGGLNAKSLLDFDDGERWRQ